MKRGQIASGKSPAKSTRRPIAHARPSTEAYRLPFPAHEIAAIQLAAIVLSLLRRAAAQSILRHMPALENKRWERFAQGLHCYGIKRRAYAEAGYRARKPLTPGEPSPLDRCATRLSQNVQVKKRLQELAAMAEKRHLVTVDSLLTELEEARQHAIENAQSGAEVSAVTTKARLVGLLVDRKETGGPGDFAALSTTDELVDALRKQVGDDAADALAQLLERAAPADEASADPAPAIDLAMVEPANRDMT